ncbi:MAG: hypothetical protein HY303_03375 [Candidatus Wallbacteria bacterium]|nr:hypothetical protein [Candidatus Wallbacteria bacterium]
MADAFAPAGLLLFLAALAPPRVLGLPELERVLPALCPPIALLACLSLSERSGWRRVLAQLPVMLSFGLVFPWLATHLGKVYGFGGRPAATLAGLPAGLPLAWCAFLLLALALTERVAWHGLLPGWLRSRRPIVNGLILAALEAVWDPALLSRGLLWSAAPSWYAWPLRYTPGWPLAHFAIGNLWQDLFDTWEDLPPGALRRWGLALGLLVWPPLFFVLSSGLVPARPDWVPQLAAALADVAFASLGTATLVAAGSAAAARARRAVCRPRVLFTTATAPFAPHDGGEDILDYYASRFTRGQGPFVTESESIYLGSHLLARNLRSPSRVLDSPTLEELEAELRRHPYEFVAIGFKNIAKPKVKRMCRLVRRVSPGSRIVLGGYGVVCLDRDLSEDDSLEGLYDHACREEGVGFMRRLLGEDPLAPVDPTLPLQRVFPLGMRFMPQTMRPVVAGFGCARRCAFCATSAFFSGRHVRIAGAAEIALAVRRAFRERPDLAAVPIFDEDWMADLERAREVGRLLENAPELPPGAAPLSVFATAAGLMCRSSSRTSTTTASASRGASWSASTRRPRRTSRRICSGSSTWSRRQRRSRCWGPSRARSSGSALAPATGWSRRRGRTSISTTKGCCTSTCRPGGRTTRWSGATTCSTGKRARRWCGCGRSGSGPTCGCAAPRTRRWPRGPATWRGC